MKAESEGTSVRITVEDDGPGIEPEFHPQVFDPFRQADGSPTRAHDGLERGPSALPVCLIVATGANEIGISNAPVSERCQEQQRKHAAHYAT